mgnify:CR=1 FL=1
MEKGKKSMLEKRIIFGLIAFLLFYLIIANLIISYNLNSEVSKLQQDQIIILNQIGDRP